MSEIAVSTSFLRDPLYAANLITRLLNNIGRIFQEKFKDNPDQTVRIDHKLRLKQLEKNIAHGIKHG